MIPELERNCNSWIIVSKETGKPVFETFNRTLCEMINTNKYEILTALQWLVRFNKEIKKVA